MGLAEGLSRLTLSAIRTGFESSSVEPTALAKPKPAKDICPRGLRADDEASELESDRVPRVHRCGRRIRSAGMSVLPEPAELHVRGGLRWICPAPDLGAPHGRRRRLR